MASTITNITWDNVVFLGYYGGGYYSYGGESVMTVYFDYGASAAFGDIYMMAGAGPAGPVAIGPYAGDLGGGLSLDATTGQVLLQWYETFNDINPGPDGIYQSGTVTIEFTLIPAPGALALLGVAGLASRRRRR